MKHISVWLLASLILFNCNGNKAENSSILETSPNLNSATLVDDQQGSLNNSKNESTIAVGNMRLVASYKVGESLYFKRKVGSNFEFPDDFIVENGILYLLSYHNNNLVILDPKSGESTSTTTINKLIKECSEKYYGVNDIYVVGDKLYLKCLSAVVKYNLTTEEVDVITYSKNVMHLLVLNDQSLISFSNDTATYYDANGTLLKAYAFPEYIHDNAINFSDTIFEKGHNEVFKYSLNLIKSGQHYKEVSISDSKINGEKMYLHAITPSYYVMLEHKNRDRLFLINRKTNRLDKEVTFDPGLLKFESLDIPAEDLANGLRIVAEDDHNFYMLFMKDKVIQVYHLKA
jgi:hypothetical protein